MWLRIGQLAYFGFNIFTVFTRIANPTYVAESVTDLEGVCSFISLVCIVLLSEAIVRIISEFAKMIEKHK